jgi:hypothetical protein
MIHGLRGASKGNILIFVWARILALAAGWIAALSTGLLAGLLLGIPPLPVVLASGMLWTCLLLLG